MQISTTMAWQGLEVAVGCWVGRLRVGLVGIGDGRPLQKSLSRGVEGLSHHQLANCPLSMLMPPMRSVRLAGSWRGGARVRRGCFRAGTASLTTKRAMFASTPNTSLPHYQIASEINPSIMPSECHQIAFPERHNPHDLSNVRGWAG